MFRCHVLVLLSLLWLFPSVLGAQPLPRPNTDQPSAQRPPSPNTATKPALTPTPPAQTANPAAKKGEEAVPLDFSQSKRSPYWDRPYLFAAYALVWWVFFFYLISMRQRQREVQAELQRLQQALDDLKQGKA